MLVPAAPHGGDLAPLIQSRAICIPDFSNGSTVQGSGGRRPTLGICSQRLWGPEFCELIGGLDPTLHGGVGCQVARVGWQGGSGSSPAYYKGGPSTRACPEASPRASQRREV